MVDFMRGAGCGAGCVILDTIRAIFQEAFRVAKAIKALGDLDRWNGWNPPKNPGNGRFEKDNHFVSILYSRCFGVFLYLHTW